MPESIGRGPEPDEHEGSEQHQPEVIAIKPYEEGGFDFLKRALATAIADPSNRVIIDSGGLMLTYEHRPGNASFMDGIIEITGTPRSSKVMTEFERVASAYDIAQGLQELGYPD